MHAIAKTISFRKSMERAGIGILIFSLSLPSAFFLTILTFRFWRWLETVTGIESFGHSGPAGWCFWLVYGVLVLLALYIWWSLDRERQNPIA